MKKIYYFLIVFAVMLFSCTEKTLEPISESKGKPGGITEIETEPIPGGATVNFRIPNVEDILSVKAVYTLTNGKKRESITSYYGNQVVIEGFNDIIEHEALFYTINRAQVASNPVSVKFTPLESPLSKSVKSASIIPDFGGVNFNWRNEDKATMTYELLAQDEKGDLQIAQIISSKSDSMEHTLRGYLPEPRKFGMVIRDNFGNVSDMLIPQGGTLIPLFEEKLDKSKMTVVILGSDASFSASVDVFWNSGQDSLIIPVTPSSGYDSVEALLSLPVEKAYTFTVRYTDTYGHHSLALTGFSTSYGEIYRSVLRNRMVKDIVITRPDATISWHATTEENLVRSEVRYTDASNEVKIIRVLPGELSTVCPSLKAGTTFEHRSLFLPEPASIDTFYLDWETENYQIQLNKSLFVDAFKPGDNTSPHPGTGVDDWQLPITDFAIETRSLAKIWDGGARNNSGGATILHTADQSGDWGNAVFKFPHKFTFSIGALAYLKKVRVHCRGDVSSFTGHSPRYFELWATDMPKELSDFGTQAEFEQYYRTTYVTHKPVDNQIQTNPNGDASHSGQEFIEPAPTEGIYNWQRDWVKLGNFEIGKPSKSNYNTRNEADNTVWAAGSDFNLNDVGKRVKYIRIVMKFPNWSQTNCVNWGEITFFGDDL